MSDAQPLDRAQAAQRVIDWLERTEAYVRPDDLARDVLYLLAELQRVERERDEACENTELAVKNGAWNVDRLHERVARLEARLAEARGAMRVALNCKGSYEGTVSERGGYPALCPSCVDVVRTALAASAETPEATDD